MENASIRLLVLIIVITAPKTASNESEDINNDEDETKDDEHHRYRWSMFLPRFAENVCFTKCIKANKPFSRLVGVRCQCLCPINAGAYNLCPPSGGIVSCYDFCKNLGYYKGGGCLYNRNCFCFCGRHQDYNASIVYEPDPS